MPTDNAILASLPLHERQALLPKLEPTILHRSQVLCDAGDELDYAYFPTGGLISLLTLNDNGDAAEVAIVTRDGFVGMPIILHVKESPYQVVVRVPGQALRIRARVLRDELRRLRGLDTALLQYTHHFVASVCARVVCDSAHTPVQRLSGWLLTVRDAANGDQFELTQDAISLSLGLPRTVVTRAALELQDAGLIFYRRGRVVIRDRHGLSTRACNCVRGDHALDYRTS